MEQSDTRKIRYGRWGLAENPVGLQVILPWKDSKGSPRTLLGDVIGVYRDEGRGSFHLRVRHFNGEDWPVEPCAASVDVLLPGTCYEWAENYMVALEREFPGRPRTYKKTLPRH